MFAARKRLTQAILTLVSVWSLVTGASAETIMLVTGNDYPPFTDETLPHRGMITELVERAFGEVGHHVIIVFRPWKRGYEETKKGVFAATFPYIRTAERVRDFYYSNPINTVYTRIFVTRDSPIKALEDLTGRRICVPLGYGISKHLEGLAGPPAHDSEASPIDLAGCLRMLLAGRKDFFIINEINGWATIQNTFNTKRDFRTLDTIFEGETHHLIVSRTHPRGEELVEQFNRGSEALRRTGALEDITSRHLKGILE